MENQQLAIGFPDTGRTSGEHVSRDLVSFLVHHPSMDEIAQHLTLRTLAELQPWECLVYECDRLGRLHLLGSFGTGECRDTLTDCVIFDDPVYGPPLRRGRPFATFGLDGTGLEGTGLEGNGVAGHATLVIGPEVVWPIATPSRLVGVVQVGFLAVPDRVQVADSLGAVADALGLYWALHGVHARLPEGDLQTLSLTPRQVLILANMAKGLTNPEIAAAINYSVSTVRQESMAIYKALGVANRVQAVEAAQRKGIIR